MTAEQFSQDYFSLFQLPANFEVDLQQLAERFRQLQRDCHPDRYASGSAQDKRLAEQLSSRVNEAYQTLKSPVRRAHYLLSLQGVEIDPQQTIGNDPAFLMHQMSIREQLSALKHDSGAEQRLDHLRQEMDTLIDHQCEEFVQAWSADQLEQASKAAIKMQFLDKLEQELDRVEQDILDY